MSAGSGVAPFLCRSAGFCIHADTGSTHATICSAVKGRFTLMSFAEVLHSVASFRNAGTVMLSLKFLSGAQIKFKREKCV